MPASLSGLCAEGAADWLSYPSYGLATLGFRQLWPGWVGLAGQYGSVYISVDGLPGFESFLPPCMTLDKSFHRSVLLVHH